MTEAKGPRRFMGLRRDSGNHQHTHVKQQLQQQQHHAKQKHVKQREQRIIATTDGGSVSDHDAAPVIPPASPGTPPKKIWERQYRTFLNHRNTTTTNTKSTNTKGTAVPPVLPLDQAQHHPAQQHPSTSHRETSVRGGKLFGPKLFNRSTATSVTPPVRRRVLSASMADDLGSTMRKGVGRGTYPALPTSSGGGNATTTTTTNHPGMPQALYPTSASSSSSSNNNNNNLMTMNHPSMTQSLRSVSTSGLANFYATALSEQDYNYPPDQDGDSPPTFLRPRIAQQEEQDDDDSDITDNWTDSERSLNFSQYYNNNSLSLAHQIMATTAVSTTTQSASSSAVDPQWRAATTTTQPLAPPILMFPPNNNVSSMKKAFTEFHNAAETGCDSVSAYLGGDDSSQRDASNWRSTTNHHHHHHHRVRSLSSSSSVMPSVLEGFSAHVAVGTTRFLRPVLGTDKWQSGRRYLIAPAVLKACHNQAAAPLWNQGGMATTETATDDTSRFGTIVLGKCWLSYKQQQSPPQSGESATDGNDPSVTSTISNNDEGEGWASACLVLRQNYLLEFDAHANLWEQDQGQSQALPRGYAHLQYAVAYKHTQCNDVVELHFFGSPCAKSDPRILLLRVEDATQVDAWQSFLNRAASLTIEDVYDIHPEMLGKGQYSTVHKATRRGGQHGPVAVKLFDKNQFWRLVVKGVERADTLVRECSVQATLTSQHPDLAGFIHLGGYLETADHVILEMELVPQGTDLFKHISKRGVLPEAEAARILAQILQVIVAMNSVGLSHRDIKPANVLLCHGNDMGNQTNTASVAPVKVCDFGMATFCGNDGLVRGRCGTPGYVAPEIFTAGLHGGYGNKVDIFSAGVTLYVMLCGYEPFYGTSDDELIEANRNAVLEFPKEEWSIVSKQAMNLVRSMMTVDPDKRPTAAQVLADPWIRKHTTTLNHNNNIHSFHADPANTCLIL